MIRLLTYYFVIYSFDMKYNTFSHMYDGKPIDINVHNTTLLVVDDNILY